MARNKSKQTGPRHHQIVDTLAPERSADSASARRREKYRNDPQGWCEYYLSNYFISQGAPFHTELMEDAMTGDDMARSAPREHAKSTVMTLGYPMFCLCNELFWFIIICGETHTRGQDFLADIREELETNERIREDYGDLRGTGKAKWTDDELELSNGRKIQAAGTGDKIRGLRHGPHRPDLFIGDDLENDESVVSKEQRDKIDRWMRRAVMSLGQGMQIVIVGTILHQDSLLSRLLSDDDFPGFTKKQYNAGLYDEQPLWPDKWPLEALRKRRHDIGTAAYNQEFENDPIGEETRIFDKDKIKQYQFATAYLQLAHATPLLGVDLAVSAEESADFSAFAVALSLDARILFPKIVIERLDEIEEQIELAGSLCRDYDIQAIGIGKAHHEACFDQLWKKWQAKKHLWIDVWVFPERINKHIRHRTLLSGPVERGDIAFADDISDNVLDHFYWYPKGKHDDAVDGVEKAVLLDQALHLADGSVPVGYANDTKQYTGMDMQKLTHYL